MTIAHLIKAVKLLIDIEVNKSKIVNPMSEHSTQYNKFIGELKRLRVELMNHEEYDSRKRRMLAKKPKSRYKLYSRFVRTRKSRD